MMPSKDLLVVFSKGDGAANGPRLSILRKRLESKVTTIPVVGAVGGATNAEGKASAGTDVSFTGTTPNIDKLKIFIGTGVKDGNGADVNPATLAASVVNSSLGDLEEAGSVFEFGPSGMTFATPIEVTFPISPAFVNLFYIVIFRWWQ